MLNLSLQQILLILYSFWLIMITVITFCLYGWDKRAAKLDRRRTPEASLHLLAFLGGWLGGLAGQKYFRHKTRKLSFQILFWLTGIWHLAIVAVLIKYL